jgi:hypothetical protein
METPCCILSPNFPGRRTMMTRTILRAASLLLMLFICLTLNSPTKAQAPQTKSNDEPFVADYYYKAKWGYADEFIRLFKKNHFPVLKKQMETGRILSVTAVKPRYHATEDGRWDYRVTIVFKNMAAASDQASEEPIIRQLFPDQETYKLEEQRRFEILLGHWDVPILSVELTK